MQGRFRPFAPNGPSTTFFVGRNRWVPGSFGVKEFIYVGNQLSP